MSSRGGCPGESSIDSSHEDDTKGVLMDDGVEGVGVVAVRCLAGRRTKRPRNALQGTATRLRVLITEMVTRWACWLQETRGVGLGQHGDDGAVERVRQSRRPGKGWARKMAGAVKV